MSWVFLNQEFVQDDKATISIHDRGFLFGDGVFTTAKVENGEVSYWEKHCARLDSHCHALNISPPNIEYSVIRELIERNHAFEGIWKLKIVITGGNDYRLSLPFRKFGTVLMTLDRYRIPEGIAKLCLYPHPIEIPTAKLKTLSYIHRLMVRQYALDQGADDALVCSLEGWVLEGAFSNIYWMQDDQIVTPSFTLPLLAGTHLSSFSNYRQDFISYENLREKKEVYLCNAMCTRVCELM